MRGKRSVFIAIFVLVVPRWISLAMAARGGYGHRGRCNTSSNLLGGFLESSIALSAGRRGKATQSFMQMQGSEKEIKTKPRVLCTGLGVVNGVGVGIDEFWKNLTAGKNVIDRITQFDPTDMRCGIACEVRADQFDAKIWYKEAKQVNRNDRYTNFAMAASRLALNDAGINPELLDPQRFGILIGSGIGGISWMEKECEVMRTKGHRKVSPFLIPAMISNTAPGTVAIELNAKGPNHGVVSACATGGHAIGQALRYIQNGEADVIVCGGSEASISPLSFAGFNALGAMCAGYNDNPKKGCRPFDAKRAGFVMGEGAGVMILETEEHAVRRNANNVYGEMAGYAANCDAHHITAPSPGGVGLAKCLEMTMQDANVDKSEVGYINAHGTSTPYNDKSETMAFKKAFGEDLARKLLISSTKSMTGHCLGAAGGIEACVAAKVLKTGVIPPTINYEYPDPECDLFYCPNTSVTVKEPLQAVMSDTLGFGGHNAALLLKRYSQKNRDGRN